jgi:hypothetical protein
MVEAIGSGLLAGIPHGFLGRRGGVSPKRISPLCSFSTWRR